MAVMDVPGAFLRADMPEDETVHVRITGIMVDTFLEIDPDLYGVWTVCCDGREGDGTVPGVAQALYGTLCAARLYWEKLSRKLIEYWGFETNPYDSGVVNKMINGKQCTVVWHVDDVRCSHVDPMVVENMIDMMSEEFGKDALL